MADAGAINIHYNCLLLVTNAHLNLFFLERTQNNIYNLFLPTKYLANRYVVIILKSNITFVLFKAMN